jgi:hypothetical protein
MTVRRIVCGLIAVGTAFGFICLSPAEPAAASYLPEK